MRLRRFLPGAALSAALAGLAWGLQALEGRWFGQPPLEALVIAILLGMAWRNTFQVGPRTGPGLELCAKQVLEVAVLMLGATMNLRELMAGGPVLLLSVAMVVCLSLQAGTLLGRQVFRLKRTAATLIAVGNAICGNSAIAAVAPLIGASACEVASAVAFTAVLGVGMVLLLPHAILPLFHLSDAQYGVLVGMTVYAVPQVLAASFPVSELAGQMATLVKLMRVLMLGPVALWYSLTRRSAEARKLGAGQLLPWFIAGFLLLSGLRTLGIIPATLAAALKETSRLLTVVSMAALGLGVDLRALRAAGPRTTGAVSLSLLFLLLLSVALIKALRLGHLSAASLHG